MIDINAMECMSAAGFESCGHGGRAFQKDGIRIVEECSMNGISVCRKWHMIVDSDFGGVEVASSRDLSEVLHFFLLFESLRHKIGENENGTENGHQQSS